MMAGASVLLACMGMALLFIGRCTAHSRHSQVQRLILLVGLVPLSRVTVNDAIALFQP